MIQLAFMKDFLITKIRKRKGYNHHVLVARSNRLNTNPFFAKEFIIGISFGSNKTRKASICKKAKKNLPDLAYKNQPEKFRLIYLLFNFLLLAYSPYPQFCIPFAILYQ